MRAEHDDALVLRSVDYGEADRVVTLLTRRGGKLAALARSARSSKRRFAGALEGFALIDVELGRGRGALASLRSARVVRAFPSLLADLARMSAAGAVLRLTRELVPEHIPEGEVFEELLRMLEAFDAQDAPARALQLCFEVRLLALTGFAPLLDACGACGKRPEPGKSADFDPERGSLVCQACGGAPQRLRGVVRERLSLALAGGPAAAARAPWTAPELDEAARALELFLAHRLQRAPRHAR